MTPRNVVSAVAWGLVGTMFTGVVGIIILAVLGRTVPDVVANVTLTVVGAVAGLLARTGSDGPSEVQVVNPPQDPVNTIDAGESSVGILLLVILVVYVATRLL